MRGFLASFVMLMRQIGAGKTAEGNEPEDPQPHVPRFFFVRAKKCGGSLMRYHRNFQACFEAEQVFLGSLMATYRLRFPSFALSLRANMKALEKSPLVALSRGKARRE